MLIIKTKLNNFHKVRKGNHCIRSESLGKPIFLTKYDTDHSQLKHKVDGYITDLSVDGILNRVKKLYKDHKLRNNLE